MQDFRSTVLTSAPSFAVHIMEAMQRKKIDPKTLALRIGLFGAEPWPEEVRQYLEDNLNIQAYEIFGVTELIEPGVAGECTAKKGLHVFEDHFLPEIIDPVSGEVMGEGREGELVLTTLTMQAYPLLRYRTSDVTALHTEPCACGRTLVRMEKVLKRTDPMVCVRGINVFPEKIEEVLRGFEGVGPGYSLSVRARMGMNDQLTVRVEVSRHILEASEERKTILKERLQMAFRRAVGIGVEVEFVKEG
jgi:phenylacetate-CoA ligase